MTTHPKGSGTHPNSNLPEKYTALYDHGRDTTVIVKDVATERDMPSYAWSNKRTVLTVEDVHTGDTYQHKFSGVLHQFERVHTPNTFGDMHDALDLREQAGSFDTATPRRRWDLTNQGDPFVMRYPEDGAPFPRPLTHAGLQRLREYNDREGTNFPTSGYDVLKKVDSTDRFGIYIRLSV
jgi:hypothetical protein